MLLFLLMLLFCLVLNSQVSLCSIFENHKITCKVISVDSTGKRIIWSIDAALNQESV